MENELDRDKSKKDYYGNLGKKLMQTWIRLIAVEVKILEGELSGLN